MVKDEATLARASLHASGSGGVGTASAPGSPRAKPRERGSARSSSVRRERSREVRTARRPHRRSFVKTSRSVALTTSKLPRIDTRSVPESSATLEERLPVAGLVQPLLPPSVELFFGSFWQTPERDAAWRVEHFRAAMGRDSTLGSKNGAHSGRGRAQSVPSADASTEHVASQSIKVDGVGHREPELAGPPELGGGR